MSDEVKCGTIMAIMLDRRVDNAVAVQGVLTKHGCAIRMRLGLHEVDKEFCANWGLVLLQICGTCCEAEALKTWELFDEITSALDHAGAPTPVFPEETAR